MADVESQAVNPAEAESGFLSWVKKNPLYVAVAVSVLVMIALFTGLHLGGKMPYQDSEEPSEEAAVTGNQTNNQNNNQNNNNVTPVDSATLTALTGAQNLAGLNQETLAKLTPAVVNQVTDQGQKAKLEVLMKAMKEKERIEALLATQPATLEDADRTLLTSAVATPEKYALTPEQVEKINKLLQNTKPKDNNNANNNNNVVEYKNLIDFLADNKTVEDLKNAENATALTELKAVLALSEEKLNPLLLAHPTLKALLDSYTESLKPKANVDNTNKDAMSDQESLSSSEDEVVVATPDVLITEFNNYAAAPSLDAFMKLEARIKGFAGNKDNVFTAITTAEDALKAEIGNNPKAKDVLDATNKTLTNYYDVYVVFRKLDIASKLLLRAQVAKLLAYKALKDHALLPVYLGFEAHSIARVELDPKLKELGPKGADVSDKLDYSFLFTFKLDTWKVNEMEEAWVALKALMEVMNGNKQAEENVLKYENVLVRFEQFAATLKAFYKELEKEENEKLAAKMQFQTTLMKLTFNLMKALWGEAAFDAVKVKTFGTTMKQADLVEVLLEAIKNNNATVLNSVKPKLEALLRQASIKNPDLSLYLAQVTILPSMMSLCTEFCGTDLKVSSVNKAKSIPYVDLPLMPNLNITNLKTYSKVVGKDLEILKKNGELNGTPKLQIDSTLKGTMDYQAEVDARIVGLENEQKFVAAPLSANLITEIKDKFTAEEDLAIIDNVFKPENNEKFGDLLRLLASTKISQDAALVDKIVNELATLRYNANRMTTSITPVKKTDDERKAILAACIAPAKDYASKSFFIRFINSSRNANKKLTYKFDNIITRNPSWVEPTGHQLDGTAEICTEAKSKMNEYVNVEANRASGLLDYDIIENNLAAFLDYAGIVASKNALHTELDNMVAVIAFENKKAATS